jgi:hypothetical protein
MNLRMDIERRCDERVYIPNAVRLQERDMVMLAFRCKAKETF